jgi:hypothetical protein
LPNFWTRGLRIAGGEDGPLCEKAIPSISTSFPQHFLAADPRGPDNVEQIGPGRGIDGRR